MGIDIAALDTAGRDELLEHWRTLIGRPPPKHISRALLIQILCQRRTKTAPVAGATVHHLVDFGRSKSAPFFGM